MNTVDEIFLSRVQDLCNESDIDIITLGNRLGYDFDTTTNLRRGRLISLKMLVDVANYFHIATDFLCRDTLEPNPASPNDISELLNDFVRFLQLQADELQKSADYSKESFDKAQKKADAAKKQADNALRVHDFFKQHLHNRLALIDAPPDCAIPKENLDE